MVREAEVVNCHYLRFVIAVKDDGIEMSIVIVGWH